MQYARVVEHSESAFESVASRMVHAAMQAASNGTDRSEQQREFKLGASNIGHCRQHAVLMIRQTPPSDERDVTAAFIGTVVGDAIEKQLKVMHPNLVVQEEGLAPERFSDKSRSEQATQVRVRRNQRSSQGVDKLGASRAGGRRAAGA